MKTRHQASRYLERDAHREFQRKRNREFAQKSRARRAETFALCQETCLTAGEMVAAAIRHADPDVTRTFLGPTAALMQQAVSMLLTLVPAGPRAERPQADPRRDAFLRQVFPVGPAQPALLTPCAAPAVGETSKKRRCPPRRQPASVRKAAEGGDADDGEIAGASSDDDDGEGDADTSGLYNGSRSAARMVARPKLGRPRARQRPLAMKVDVVVPSHTVPDLDMKVDFGGDVLGDAAGDTDVDVPSSVAGDLDALFLADVLVAV